LIYLMVLIERYPDGSLHEPLQIHFFASLI
jgi:hypothetical protein